MPSPDLTAEQRAPSDLIAQSRWALRRALPWLLVLILLSGAAAGALTRLRPSTYVSTVSFVVQTASGANDTETLIRTMQALVDSEIIGADLATAVGSDLQPEQVVDRLTVLRPPGAGVLTVEVSDTDAERSRRLAEELIPVFERRVGELSQPEPGELAVTYSIRPWGSGAVSTSVSGRPVVRNTVLGLVLGAIIGLLLLAVRAASRPVLLTPAQARTAFRLPLLGALPSARRNGPDPLDGLQVLLRGSRAPGWPATPRRVLVVGSPTVPDRAVLLIDIACAVQPTGDAVLVDTHGGKASVGSLFGLRTEPGLAEVLSSNAVADKLLKPLGEPGEERVAAPGGGVLRALPRGDGVLGAGDGPRLGAVVTELSRNAVVVVDALALTGPLTWGALLGTVDAVVVLATLGRTTADDARTTGDALLAMTDRPVGVLLLEADRLLVPAVAEPDLLPPGSSPPGEGVLAGRMSKV